MGAHSAYNFLSGVYIVNECALIVTAPARLRVQMFLGKLYIAHCTHIPLLDDKAAGIDHSLVILCFLCSYNSPTYSASREVSILSAISG